ncbi:5505_t:CDS:2 [Ambispora leptoticha]|uniref:5505_t:CDS:1 n=1 Tax=Ambispora leptoticha TaxID=144679 RepID=A0A9N9G1Y5_9GLOM|nr:5505_t:CDS:2 [Ambispora leptoticha]
MEHLQRKEKQNYYTSGTQHKGGNERPNKITAAVSKKAGWSE